MIDNYEIGKAEQYLGRMSDVFEWLTKAVAEREKETERADAAEEKLAELEERLAAMAAERSA